MSRPLGNTKGTVVLENEFQTGKLLLESTNNNISRVARLMERSDWTIRLMARSSNYEEYRRETVAHAEKIHNHSTEFDFDLESTSQSIDASEGDMAKVLASLGRIELLLSKALTEKKRLFK